MPVSVPGVGPCLAFVEDLGEACPNDSGLQSSLSALRDRCDARTMTVDTACQLCLDEGTCSAVANCLGRSHSIQPTSCTTAIAGVTGGGP